MNALMTIQVRVLSAAALAQLRALDAQARKTGQGVGTVGKQAQWGLPYLSKWGNQVQWAGRQLIYNFTLPIALAMGAATKFALENEKAMTRVIKVYGDGSAAFRRLAKTEIPALEKAFVALSNRFGVHQKEVIEIAGDWAAAGASGIALAKSVKLTLETMVLGELEAAEATQNLIAIQAQYGQNINDLTKTIDVLNMVENQTGTSMEGLMQGMARAAGVARDAGVDVEHLAAMMAALTPATGSAAAAGNGLKTIISRILSPTQEGVEVMREMGVQVDALGWQGLTATERLERMAEQFENLSSAQRVHVSTVVASRWQINRFGTLMRAITNENGYYQRSLEATSDATRIYKQRQYELNKVLESNPQRVKQAWVILQNAAADVITPLLPTIAYLASEIARLASAFANLSPEIQKMVLAGLIFLALIGPIARYTGSIANLFGILMAATHKLGASLLWLVKSPLKLVTFAFGALHAAAMVAYGKIFYVALRIGMVFTAIGPMIARGIAGASVAIRAFPAAMAAAWVGIQATFVVFAATMRSLWIGFAIGFYRLQVALAMGMQALWTLTAANLRGIFLAMVRGIAKVMAVGVTALLNPWVAVGVAIVGVVYTMQDEIKTAWNNFIKNLQASGALESIVAGWHAVVRAIVDAFWALPEGVRDALLTVLRIVQSIAVQIYEWMSYLNPFARHSPSLVESVTEGMDEIQRQYARAGALGGVFRAAARDLAMFKKEAARSGGGEFADERKDVKKSGGNLALFDRLQGHLKKLQPLLNRQAAAVTAQEAVVDRWANKLDRANKQLDNQRAKLDRLQNRLSEAQAEYDKHAQKLQDFANAPIKGMGAMDDAIFANEMAQKRLRLEMLKLGDTQKTIDDTRNKLSGLYGDLEVLGGRTAELRAAGAGSDVLGPLNDQIAMLEDQGKKMRDIVNNNPVNDLQKQLDDLAREGEILDLEKSIKFDPMIREIDKLANAQEELSYEQIVKGIKRQQEAMAELEPVIKRLTGAVEEQQGVVDEYEARRDRIQAGYDREQEQLSALQDAYQKTQQTIQDLEGALRDMGQTASEALQKAKEAADKAKAAKDAAKKKGIGSGPDVPEPSQAVKTFRAGAGADWADVGRKAQIGRLGGMEDQSKLIEEFAQRELDKMNKIMGGMDMFGPLKRWWSRTWEWLKENVGPVVEALGRAIGAAVSAIGDVFGGKGGGLAKSAMNVWEDIKKGAVAVFTFIGKIGKLFGPDVERIFKAIGEAGARAWEKIGPEVEKFLAVLGPLWTVLKEQVLPVLGKVAATLGGALLAALKIVASVISHTLGPVLNFVVDVLAALIKIIRGFVQIVVGLFTLDLKMIWEGVKAVFGGLFDIIIGIFKAGWSILYNVVKGIVVGVVEFFQWLFDEIVGHSIIPDLIDAIWDNFKKLLALPKWVWDEILKPVVDFFIDLWKDVKSELSKWWGNIKDVWSDIKNLGTWVWNQILDPILDFYKDLWTDVKNELKEWWGNIKQVWSNITDNIGQWWVNNIWNPVINKLNAAWTDFKNEIGDWWRKIKEAWSNITGNIGDWWTNNIWNPVKNRLHTAWVDIKAEVGDWWERLKNTWSNITNNIGTWWKNNVTDPIFNKMTGVWQDIKAWFENNKDIITNPVSKVVNGAISAINKMIGGLNKIADVLPGIDWHINLIEPLASGGAIPSRRVGNGFKTTGARAIVGEGNPNYPEYVIPTDPTYRMRAKALLQQAGSRIGMGAVPMHASGGILGAIGDAVGNVKDWGKDAWDWAKDGAANVVSKIFEPFKGAVNGLIDNIDWNYGRSATRAVANDVFEWIRNADEVYKEKAKQQPVPPGAIGGYPIKGGDWDRVYWRGHQFNVRTVKMIKAAEAILGQAYHITQGSYSTSVGASGTTHAGGGVFDATSPVTQSSNNALRKVGFASWIRSPSQGPWPWHIHAVAIGDKTLSSSAAWQVQSYLSGGNGLAKGGIVKRRYGGVMARIGEGRNDEAVVPLPRNWRSDVMQTDEKGNGKNYHFYGDLKFPNIKSGDDAQKFLENLETLVRD